MSETPHPAPAPKPAVPAGRSADEIKRDPRVADAVARVADAVTDAKEFAGEITLFVARERIVEVCRAMKEDGFDYLVDLSGVSYTLYAFSKTARARLKVSAPDETPIPSVTAVWKTANWHERETWDMLGIVFDGHPNLERILMWEGFNGHPLRKDFPVRGVDTGARIYPEVFPEGGGPMAGSTGKDVKDVNVYREEWRRYGTWPAARIPGQEQLEPAPELADVVADSAKPTEEAPWHDPEKPLADRMALAANGSLKDKLFAAMAQTDCTACGWDCEGYAAALASGESKDITLCVPGEAETESMLKKLMTEAGKL